MDRQALEVQEDLDLVLGDLDSQLLVAMDVRGAVVVALDGDVAVGVQLRRPSTPRRRTPRWATALSAAFSIFSKRSRRETPKRRWRLVIDALDAHHQRAVDLGDRGKS